MTNKLQPISRGGGPKTLQGKRISSLNRLSHGLRIHDILPCKKEECFYIDTCPIYLELPDEWDKIEYGAPCVREYQKAQKWLANDLRYDRFHADKPEEVKLLKDLIISDIMYERAQKAIRIFSQNRDPLTIMFMQAGMKYNYPKDLRLLAYYTRRIIGFKFSSYRRAAPYLKSMIDNERRKRELLIKYAEYKKRNGI